MARTTLFRLEKRRGERDWRALNDKERKMVKTLEDLEREERTLATEELCNPNFRNTEKGQELLGYYYKAFKKYQNICEKNSLSREDIWKLRGKVTAKGYGGSF